jgi:hypothetical protein
MSDELKKFEKLLEGQPLGQVPKEWRKEILSAAAEVQAVHRRQPISIRSLPSLLRSLLWPRPVAWAGLATVWIFILGVNLSLRDHTLAMAKKVSPPSPEAVAELQQQHRLLAELMETSDTFAADRQKIFVPKPRSERIEILTV